MALIIRTAGIKRTKVEIKRDFQNLISMWEDIKNKTIKYSRFKIFDKYRMVMLII